MLKNQTNTLMFADDLLLFARAYHSSITKIVEAFRKFSRASGLEASIKKSCIYFTGVKMEDATDIATAVSLLMGELPFRYLGVPLAARKLNYSQCKILVDKITLRAQAWMPYMLSYDGRLQLIRCILSSMQNYWAHIFPLSKKLIKAVEMVCRRFLWTRKTLESKKALVAWHNLFYPMVAGGWNLVNMAVWN